MARPSAAKRRKALIDRANAIDNDRFKLLVKNMTTYQANSQSVNQSVSPPTNQSTSQSTNQSISQPTNQSINQTFSIKFVSSSDLTDAQHASIFALTESNMREMYESCDWGWDEKAKKDELRHEDARFLYVTSINQSISQLVDQTNIQTFDQSTDQSTDQPTNQSINQSTNQSTDQCLAFAHIRFVIEDFVPVLYLYELQLDRSNQSIGLGLHLMKICELIGRLIDFDCVMLTCFKHNQRAMKFYLKCGYTKDEFSPDDASYLILSKACDLKHAIK